MPRARAMVVLPGTQVRLRLEGTRSPTEAEETGEACVSGVGFAAQQAYRGDLLSRESTPARVRGAVAED